MSASWVVEPDGERCIGSGACAFTAPEVFDVDDTGRVVLIGPVVAGDELVQMAVDNCPTNALHLVVVGEP